MRLKRKFFIISLVVITGSILSSCETTKSGTASRMLKFDFEEGKAYDYEMIINMDQEMMGEEMQMDMTTYYSMDVTKAEEDIKYITTTYEKFKMRMKMKGLTFEVDSEKPLPDFGNAAEGLPLDKINGMLGAIKGKQFQLKVNAEGKVLDIKGFENIAGGIADSLGLDETKRAEVLRTFNQQFNDQQVRDQFERILHIYPNMEVKVGDKWQKVMNATGPAGGKYTSVYTVKDIDGSMVTVKESSKIEPTDGSSKINGESSGTIIIDSRSGLVVNAEQKITIHSISEGKDAAIKIVSKVKGSARN